MFDVSFGEIGVAGAVALLVLGPKEFASVVRYIKYVAVKARNIISHYTAPINNEILYIKDHVLDLEGKIQPIYDLSDIEQELQDAKKGTQKRKPRRISKKNVCRTL